MPLNLRLSRHTCAFPLRLLSGALSLVGWLAVSQAQVTTAITPDGTLGTEVTQSGDVHTITGGTIRGSNQFHSFDRFSVGTGDIARFTGPTGIENILSRVTGGQQSVIDGLLRSEMSGANLYLLNPSGILLGPHASLDVSGSFHASTADVLRFADGAFFTANLSENSTLTVAPPTAFGFLRENPAGISIQGSTLRVAPGETVSVVGGDIEITGGALEVPGGQVAIASVASPGNVMSNVPGEPPGLQVDAFERLGEVTLLQDTLLNVSGDSGGTVIIRGGHLVIEQSVIMANTQGVADSASLGVDLEIAADLIVTQDSGIIADVLSTGRAGDISIHAGQVEVSQGALIGSRAFPGSSADSGEVAITTGRLVVQDTAGIATATAGGGRAGDIIAEVETLAVTRGGAITSSTIGAGTGGEVRVTASDAIVVSGSKAGFPSRVTSETAGRGDAGQIVLMTPMLHLEETGLLQTATIDAGRGGDVVAQTRALQITSGAEIRSSTLGPGQGGAVMVNATDAHLDGGRITTQTSGTGPAGNVAVEVGRLTLSGDALLSSASLFTAPTESKETGDSAAGNITVSATNSVSFFDQSRLLTSTLDKAGGQVRITTPNLLLDGGSIDVTTSGRGRAGDTIVEVDYLTVTGGSYLGGGSLFRDLTGDAQARDGAAGNVMVSATHSISISEVGSIGTVTVGEGQGGMVTVTASDSIAISSLGSIISDTLGNGKAGTVSISTPVLTMDGEAIVEARTIGDGNAGDVWVAVQQLTLTGGAQIGSTSGIATAAGDSIIGAGQAGSITVTATDSIAITGGNSTGVVRSGLFSQTASPRQETAGAAGETGGRIVVSTPHLTLDDGGRIATDTGGDALGGNIEVKVERLSLAGGAQITSGSGIDVGDTLFVGAGRGGSIAISATDTVVIANQNSGLRSNTRGNGRGGDIILEARAIELNDGAILSAESSGSGDAGRVHIVAWDTFLSENSTVTTEATQASGGHIQVVAQSLIRLQDSAITSTVGGGPGTAGGNISVDPEFVILENSRIVSNAFQGRGGDIAIVANVFLADPTSVVSAIALDSEVGIDGVVNIEAPIANLSGLVTSLPPDFASAALLLRDRCAAQLHEGIVSSLVARDRVSIPDTPEGILPSRLYQPVGASVTPPETEQQPAETPVPRREMLVVAPLEWPQIINGSSSAHVPVALKCEWTRPQEGTSFGGVETLPKNQIPIPFDP